MNEGGDRRGWILTRRETVRTTCAFKLVLFGLLLVAVAVAYSSRTLWLPALAESLIHRGEVPPADALVVENYQQDYLVFEMAGQLMREGLARRAFVPTSIFRDPTRPGLVAEGFVEVMCRVARLENPEIIPVSHAEPITLGVARQVAEVLAREGVSSVIVVAPPFRSRRSHLVYSSVLEPLGIHVSCQPARSSRTPEDWWKSWHGIQEVALEAGKLVYYRLWVLR